MGGKEQSGIWCEATRASAFSPELLRRVRVINLDRRVAGLEGPAFCEPRPRLSRLSVFADFGRFRRWPSGAFSGNKAGNWHVRIGTTSRPPLVGARAHICPSGGSALTSCSRRSTLDFISAFGKRRFDYPCSALKETHYNAIFTFTFSAFRLPDTSGCAGCVANPDFANVANSAVPAGAVCAGYFHPAATLRTPS